MIELMEEPLTDTELYAGALSKWLRALLSSWGVSNESLPFMRLTILLILLVVAVLVLLYVARKLIHFFIYRASKISDIPLLNYLIKNRAPLYIGLLAPYTLVRGTLAIIFIDYPNWISPLYKCVDIYLVLLVIWTIVAFVKSFFNVLQERPAFENKPMASYIQVITIVLYGVGIIVTFAILTERSVITILTTLGAASAIMLLMFQDSIKGFAGSIQLSANNMVELGDWITMPKYNADGNVLEVTLNTVKVENFDKTITTIPTYALISDSFQNWRGMEKSGGRRNRKSLFIKQGSIRFMKEEELEKFRKIECLNRVIKEHEKVNGDVEKALIGATIPVTNSDLFMAYAKHYLRNHRNVNDTFTLLVRQLAPSEKGLPIEFYFFTATTEWAKYEDISSEIVNHLIGMVPVFDLKVFEVLSDTHSRVN